MIENRTAAQEKEFAMDLEWQLRAATIPYFALYCYEEQSSVLEVLMRQIAILSLVAVQAAP